MKPETRAEIKGVLLKLGRWLGWSVLIPLLPFAFNQGVRMYNRQPWEGFPPLLGSGALLLTCVGIVAAGLRELNAMKTEKRAWIRSILQWMSAVFLTTLGAGYGMAAYTSYVTPTTTPEQWVKIEEARMLTTEISVVLLVVCLLISAGAIAISYTAERV